MGFELGPRRGVYIDISKEKVEKQASGEDTAPFEELDLMYRALCAMLYNYVPMSGHPGGSISSGRFVAGVVFDSLDYDVANPDREEADIVSYAAGHKTLGLYAMWAPGTKSTGSAWRTCSVFGAIRSPEPRSS
jgi:transketolase